jgi:hypothetical protein
LEKTPQKFTELIAVSDFDISQVKQKIKSIGNHFAGHTKELQVMIQKLEDDVKESRHAMEKMELAMENVKLEKRISDSNLEHTMEKMELIVKSKDLQIELLTEKLKTK